MGGIGKLEATGSKCRTILAKERLRLISDTSRSLVENGPPALPNESTLGTLRGDELKHEEPSAVCTPKQKNVKVSELEKALTEQATRMSLQNQIAEELLQQNGKSRIIHATKQLGLISDNNKLFVVRNEKLKHEKGLTEQAAAITSLQKQNNELHQQNASLHMELSNMQGVVGQLKDQLNQGASLSSETEDELSRFRAMTREHTNATYKLLQTHTIKFKEIISLPTIAKTQVF